MRGLARISAARTRLQFVPANSMAHSRDVVVFFCILKSISHNQFVPNVDDVERGIAAGKVRVCECSPIHPSE